ncbi:MAG: hypothetical protein ACLFWB_10075, partial [Armatimonadota bacterium]
MRDKTALISLVLLVFASCVAVASEKVRLPGNLNWHESFEAACEASRASDRPVLAFIYVETQPGSIALCNVLMSKDSVAQQLKNFELLGVRYNGESHRNFLQQYDVQPQVRSATEGEGQVTIYPSLPTIIYLDNDGTEYYRDKGFTPLPASEMNSTSALVERAENAFSSHLEQVSQLITLLRKTRDEPTAKAHAAAGHIFLEMTQYDRATEHLQAAMALDPTNETGAFADAYLDSIIISIADDTERCLQQLEDFRARFPDSDRLHEVEYYRAACLVALERYTKARSVLEQAISEAEGTDAANAPWFLHAQELLEA